MLINDILLTRKINIYAGGLPGVEKVKPDPLNLSVNTVVGKLSAN